MTWWLTIRLHLCWQRLFLGLKKRYTSWLWISVLLLIVQYFHPGWSTWPYRGWKEEDDLRWSKIPCYVFMLIKDLAPLDQEESTYLSISWGSPWSSCWTSGWYDLEVHNCCIVSLPQLGTYHWRGNRLWKDHADSSVLVWSSEWSSVCIYTGVMRFKWLLGLL